MERADNTARILDVKYHVLLPETEAVGGSLDYFQWTSILRAVSAFTAYHWVYRQSVKPWLIADLLILKKEMPRSLVSCYDNLARNLDAIGNAYGVQGPSQRHARAMLLRLDSGNVEAVFEHGLHEFLTEFIADNTRLGAIVAEQYLVNELITRAAHAHSDSSRNRADLRPGRQGADRIPAACSAQP
jgi:uncharacterized alpha-E superfamily protein